MARVVASSVAATCFKRINRLAPRIYAAPQQVRGSARVVSRQLGRAWPSLALRRTASTGGAVVKKERVIRVEEKEDDEDEDEDDEFDDEEEEGLLSNEDEDEESDEDDADEEDSDEEDDDDTKQGAGEDSVQARKKVDDEDDDPGELEMIRRISAEDDRTATNKKPGPWKSRFPPLSQKEKKELRAHAHRLGKSIALQHIGKWGVTPNTIKCFGDTLERNELMKVRVLDNCPTDFDQVVVELEDGLEAQIVGKVGHVLLLYRASLRKAEIDEQKQKLEKSRRPNRQERGRRA